MSKRWKKHDMAEFLGGKRQRRLRRTGWMRDMVRETVLTPADFIWPLFVIEGKNERTAIRTMPGVERLSVDLCVEAARSRGRRHSRRWRCFRTRPDHLRTEDGSKRPTTPTT
jgi:porphobilinogen synthase